MLETFLLLSALIGFLALDTTIAFQVLISQPLFACTIVGWVLGDPLLGLEIGAMMQLLWLGLIPAGATIFPEGNIASMVVAAIVVYFQDVVLPDTLLTVAFLMGILVSYIGAILTVLDRKFNGWILNRVLKAVEGDHLHEISFWEFFSGFVYFLIMAMLTFISLYVAHLVITIAQPVFTGTLEEKLTYVKPIIWGIGMAMTVNLIIQGFRKKAA